MDSAERGRIVLHVWFCDVVCCRFEVVCRELEIKNGRLAIERAGRFRLDLYSWQLASVFAQ